MYSKLNVREIISGHNKTIDSESNTQKKKIEFVYIPYLASFILLILKVPDADVKNVFGICLSILIGLYLNILVLLISSISSDNLDISISQKKVRLELLRETLYNVSYSVLVSVKAIIALFLSTIITINFESLNDLLFILINHDLNYLIQFFLGFLLYKYTIDVFLILFMILKRINTLFSKQINIERLRLNSTEISEDNIDDTE